MVVRIALKINKLSSPIPRHILSERIKKTGTKYMLDSP
jgi:hypothetical protein